MTMTATTSGPIARHEMRSLAESLALLPAAEQTAILRDLTEAEANELLYDWSFWARPNQLTPGGHWSIWLALAGRGFGKTRMGAEWVRDAVTGPTPLSAGPYRRIALVGETAADGRGVMVEGESGLLMVHPPAERPNYEPSKRRLTWPNGAVAITYSAEDPDQLRGPQFDLAWCDEIAKWRHPQQTWDNLMLGLRMNGTDGSQPRCVVTSTPRPTPLIIELARGCRLSDGTWRPRQDVTLTGGSTHDNAANLAPAFLDEIAGNGWLTAVDGFSVEDAAAEIGKSTGSVYAARSRVMRRLKAKVLEFESE